jgi:hypothetical protein
MTLTLSAKSNKNMVGCGVGLRHRGVPRRERWIVAHLVVPIKGGRARTLGPERCLRSVLASLQTATP